MTPLTKCTNAAIPTPPSKSLLHSYDSRCMTDSLPMKATRKRLNMDDTSPLDVLNALRCTKVPPILWRVQHSESQASFDENCNLTAKLSDCVPTSLYELRASLARHLKWGYSRADSYFISSFSEYFDALKWGQARRKIVGDEKEEEEDEESPVTIYKIRTCHLAPHTMVFRVDKLLQKLGIDPPPLPHSIANEYLILNRIPSRALSLHEHIEPTPRPRQTPWRRTLQRRSEIYLFQQTSSTDALCAQYLARLEVEHKRKSAFESVCEWVEGGRFEKGGEREERDGIGKGGMESLVGIIRTGEAEDQGRGYF